MHCFTLVLDLERRCWLFAEVFFVLVLHMDTVRDWCSKGLAQLLTFEHADTHEQDGHQQLLQVCFRAARRRGADVI